MAFYHFGCVQYINALPLMLAFKLGHVPLKASFTFDIPSKLNLLLEENLLDVALTSSISFFEGSSRMLAGFGIAVENEVLSVTLYYKKELSDITKIALTHHSATSVALLKILCKYWEIQPTFIPLDRNKPLESFEAFLLIGDEALERLQPSGYKTIDLAAAWHEMTNLPFVFAIFSLSKNLPAKWIPRLEEKIAEALDWSEKNFDEVIDYACRESSLSPELIRRYYRLFNYRLGEREMRGLKKFQELRECVHV